MKDKTRDFLINELILLSKHFIHKWKCLKVKPQFNIWKNELKLFTKSPLMYDRP